MINFIELDRTHNRDNFDCGIEELNYFYQLLRFKKCTRLQFREKSAVSFFISSDLFGVKNIDLSLKWQPFTVVRPQLPILKHPDQFELKLAVLPSAIVTFPL